MLGFRKKASSGAQERSTDFARGMLSGKRPCEVRAKTVSCRQAGLQADDCLLQPVDQYACHVADKGYPRDALHVPAEGYLLQSHHYHAGSRTDNEHRAAHACAISQQLPEDAVLRHVAYLGHRVHAHATGNQGNVVDDAGQYAYDAGDEIVIAIEDVIQTLAHYRQHAYLLQARYSHEDAEEEEDGAHVDARDDVDNALLRAAVGAVFLVAVEQFGDQPKQAEHQKYADKRGDMREGLEDGDEHQSAYTDPEDCLALAFCQGVVDGVRFHGCARGQRALEREGEQVGRDDDGNERGDEEFFDDSGRRDEAFVPEHDGGDVADGREGASGVGGNDDQRCVDEAVFVVGHQLAQYHDHDDGRGHVVEDGGQEEGEDGDAPEQGALAARGQQVAHEVEAAVLVDGFDDGHGAHQEEERGGRAAQVAFDDGGRGGGQAVGRDACGEVAGVEHVECPRGHEHEQGDGCLVDFRHGLECDAEVADDEEDNDCDGYG